MICSEREYVEFFYIEAVEAASNMGAAIGEVVKQYDRIKLKREHEREYRACMKTLLRGREVSKINCVCDGKSTEAYLHTGKTKPWGVSYEKGNR